MREEGAVYTGRVVEQEMAVCQAGREICRSEDRIHAQVNKIHIRTRRDEKKNAQYRCYAEAADADAVLPEGRSKRVNDMMSHRRGCCRYMKYVHERP